MNPLNIALLKGVSIKYVCMYVCMYVLYWSGLQHYTCVKCLYCMHITRSVHSCNTQIQQNACNYTGDILEVDVILCVKLHTVIQLELIKCM